MDLIEIYRDSEKQRIILETPLKIAKQYIDKPNNSINRAIMKDQINSYLSSLIRDNLRIVDSNGKEITSEMFKIENDAIIVPDLASVISGRTICY